MPTSYVERSHKRCIDLGIEKERVFSSKIVTGMALQEKLEEQRELVLTAGPFMDQLYNFVKGSNFFAMLTDGDGCILNVIGDETILTEAFRYKMVPGASMNEACIGTNAMGTAIVEGVPVQISATDHFINAYHKWTCSGAPIRNTNGQIIGSLDLTGYSESVHSHTLGMVVAAANAIEKMLEIKDYNTKLSLAKKNIETIIESIPCGILTSNISGAILTYNKNTLEMFGMTSKELMSKNMVDLFVGWEKAIADINTGDTFLDEDVFVNCNTNKLQYNLSIHPIYNTEGQLREIIYIFKELKRIRKLANRVAGSKAIYTFDKIIGSTDRFLQTMEYAKKIADSRSTILITGESGTGKEVLAQAIHNYSARRDEPFIAINCGAIPRNLIESELFGYEEGAFTGAKRGGAPGKFEISDGGTILLDEIGEMPIDMQTNLLRVIEEGTVNRIGSTKQIPINVRIIAASNKNLDMEVKKGIFRLDLYYRLNVLPIQLPALRERKADIPLLIDYFMKTISKRINKKVVKINNETMDRLLEYQWPGNIRELENVIERIINTENTNFEIDGTYTDVVKVANKSEMCLNLEQSEKAVLLEALKQCDGNISQVSKTLGIGRNTVYRKLKKYQIECNDMEQ